MQKLIQKWIQKGTKHETDEKRIMFIIFSVDFGGAFWTVLGVKVSPKGMPK